jgi:hypothetical protein
MTPLELPKIRKRTPLEVLIAYVCVLIYGMQALAQSAPIRPGFDGPAELPRIFLHTSMSDTPAPGKTWLVKAADDLQGILDRASCGDTLRLEAGATFTGLFRLPQNKCDDSHWIIIRTDAPDASLPREGTRIRPCYAGVASLPGRPPFSCPSVKQVLAKIVYSGRGSSGPIVFASGANHYRFLGLEITRGASENRVSNLASPEDHPAADHLVFDRVWMHGTAQDETTRGLYLTGMTYVAVIDSYFSDFHCVAVTGSCVDAQDIGGGGGDIAGGPYKIVNNFLEASGQSVLFGGGPATATPADIEIRRNHLYKPILWKPGQAGFVGGTSGKPFIAKNLFELKNAQRVLFEGNILENSWGGFSQKGFAIVITPKNQSPNVCPLCKVVDITLRYNRVAHAGSGMQLANVLSDTKGSSAAGERYSIHDMVFEDIDADKYDGFGMFALVMSVSPRLRDVSLDHITAFPSRVLFGLDGATGGPKIDGFVFTNSIVAAGERQVTSTGGGPSNCATQQPNVAAMIDSCFQKATFSHNVIVGARGNWPAGNWFPGNFSDVGLVDFKNSNGGDYHLCSASKRPEPCKAASKYRKGSTDGKDVGADMDAILSATEGVE